MSTIDEALTLRHFELDRWQHSTMVAALVGAALEWADPSGIIRLLEKVAPERETPWDVMIDRSRAELAAVRERAHSYV